MSTCTVLSTDFLLPTPSVSTSAFPSSLSGCWNTLPLLAMQEHVLSYCTCITNTAHLAGCCASIPCPRQNMLMISAFSFLANVLDRDLQFLVKAWHPHHRGDNLSKLGVDTTARCVNASTIQQNFGCVISVQRVCRCLVVWCLEYFTGPSGNQTGECNVPTRLCFDEHILLAPVTKNSIHRRTANPQIA